MLRILLVDDHILFRKGMASLLDMREDLQVVGEASDGFEGIKAARALLPDLILMDVNMPHCDGLEATSVIKKEMPHVKIVMLSASESDQDLFEAIKVGAQGYLLKDLEPYQLYDLLESLSRGETPLSGTMATKILKEFSKPDKEEQQTVDYEEALTDREIDILKLVAEGLTNKEISEQLVISENTVKIHLRNILEKLQLKNRIQAAVYAVRQGMIDKDC
jgi:DNA-binding NarL/FixJ family response regulator